LTRDTEAFAKEGEQVSKGLIAGITSGLDSGLQSAGNAIKSNPYIAAGIAGGILVGAPVIGGALASAVAGGGVAAGILLASKDARTRDAWSQFGKDASEQLTRAANPFIQPLVHGAETFGDTLDKIMPNIRADFDTLAPVAEHLLTDAAGFVEKLQPGLDALVRSGAPILDALGNELPRFGAALSSAFKDISAGSAGGKQALLDLVHQIEGAIIVTGKAIEVTERWYESESALVHLFSGDLPGAVDRYLAATNKIPNATTPIGPIAQQAYAAVQRAAEDAATGVDDLTEAMKRNVAQALSQQDSDLALKGGLLDIADAFKASSGSMDTNTQKGLAARVALQGQIDKIAEHRQSLLDQKQSIGFVNDWTKKQIDLAIDDARAHGADASQLGVLKGQWDAILKLTPTKAFTTTFKTLYVSEGSPPPAQTLRGHVAFGLGGVYPGAAQGLIADRPMLVGERTVPEAAIPAPNSGISRTRALGLLGEAASWWKADVVTSGYGAARSVVPRGGGGGTVINLTVNAGMGTDGAEVGREIVKVLNQQLRTDPGAATTIKAALA
jgi:hypothetical protein